MDKGDQLVQLFAPLGLDLIPLPTALKPTALGKLSPWGDCLVPLSKPLLNVPNLLSL